MQVEAAAGLVMLAAAVAALVWANSPWHGAYEHFWEADVVLRFGGLLELDLTVREWVNNAAMALFFLLAGLEIKRQLLVGELRQPRAAALPVLAALGGMVVPALIYVAVTSGHAGAGGWGIPMATDIAFAVGVVTLAGRRIPLGARTFILTLAVVDDIGGIVVIAVFYAEQVRIGWLALAAATIVVTLALQRSDVRSLVPYLAMGSLCWLALFEAGIESAIVGVIYGLLTPIRPFHDPKHFAPVARHLVDDVERAYADGVLTDDERAHNESSLDDLTRFASECTSPLERVERRLTLWVSLLVVPVFAFANAGVRIDTSSVNTRVFLGVVLGLVVGKTVGVFTFSYLAVRLRVGTLPNGLVWRHVLGLAVTAGIGFTVALFVTSLSFTDAALTSSAKLGVLTASAAAGLLGYAALRFLSPAPARAAAAAGARQDALTWTPSGSSATS